MSAATCQISAAADQVMIVQFDFLPSIASRGCTMCPCNHSGEAACSTAACASHILTCCPGREWKGHPCLADSSHKIGPHGRRKKAFSSGSSQDPRGLSCAGRVENRVSNGAPSGPWQGRASVPIRADGYSRLRVKLSVFTFRLRTALRAPQHLL